MADTSGGISANQHAQVTTFNKMSIQGLRNDITLALRPSYPLTTTHYGECVYLAEYQPDPPGNNNEPVSCSSSSAPFPSHRASSPIVCRNLAPPSTLQNHVSKEDYERILQGNTKLKLELEAAKKAAETATKACRDLAAWTIWERDRLMRELEEVKEAHRAFINNEVDKLVAEESGRRSSYR